MLVKTSFYLQLNGALVWSVSQQNIEYLSSHFCRGLYQGQEHDMSVFVVSHVIQDEVKIFLLQAFNADLFEQMVIRLLIFDDSFFVD